MDDLDASGREDLPIADRIGLMLYDTMWLQSNSPECYAPKWPPSKTRQFWRTNGSDVHDRNSLIGFAQNVEHCYKRKPDHDRLPGDLTYIEVRLMAWRRGGHVEYKRIVKLYRERRVTP